MNTTGGYSSSSHLAARYQRGLTLVEMMVALVLGLILAAGMIQLFIGTKQTYRFYDALSRIQENGRFALDALARDIRMAGYSPLGSPSPPNAVANNGNTGITVRWVDNGLQTRTYSVGPRDASVGNIPTCVAARTSLFLNRNDGAGNQELIEGVEAIQLLYGVCIDTDGDTRIDTPLNYTPAANVTNWENVCSVRIRLLLASLDDRVVTQPQTVFFPPGTNRNVNDRCLHQVFSTTIAVRNRLP